MIISVRALRFTLYVPIPKGAYRMKTEPPAEPSPAAEITVTIDIDEEESRARRLWPDEQIKRGIERLEENFPPDFQVLRVEIIS